MILIHFIVILVMGLGLATGCASSPEVVPETLKNRVDQTVTFPDLLEDSESHRGKVVILGGEVLSAKRIADATQLEVLQIPLEDSHQPILDRMASQGRFFALEKAFLDPATFPANARVTIVGEVQESTIAHLDEMEYRYPTVAIQHLHVWEVSSADQFRNPGPRYGIFGGGSTGGRVGGGGSIGIGF